MDIGLGAFLCLTKQIEMCSTFLNALTYLIYYVFIELWQLLDSFKVYWCELILIIVGESACIDASNNSHFTSGFWQLDNYGTSLSDFNEDQGRLNLPIRRQYFTFMYKPT